MKKFIIILIVLTASSLFKESLALDTLSIKYFPMHVGNFWVYNYHRASNYLIDNHIEKLRVVSSINLNNHIYYILTGYPLGWPRYCDTLRADSISGSLRKYYNKNDCFYYFKEKLFDSLAALYNDSVKNCAIFFKCTGTSNITIFGLNSIKKSYGDSYQYGTFSKSFVLGIGINYYGETLNAPGGIFGQLTVELKGCRINGVVYGDTSMVNIRKIGEEIPDKYFLYQNYPNPFNPTTNIRYQIANNKHVTLKIYDILGKEIETLVNENQKTGTYEVNWDASKYPSGVYYYSLLTTGNFYSSKKMLLIK